MQKRIGEVKNIYIYINRNMPFWKIGSWNIDQCLFKLDIETKFIQHGTNLLPKWSHDAPNMGQTPSNINENNKVLTKVETWRSGSIELELILGWMFMRIEDINQNNPQQTDREPNMKITPSTYQNKASHQPPMPKRVTEQIMKFIQIMFLIYKNMWVHGNKGCLEVYQIACAIRKGIEPSSDMMPISIPTSMNKH